MSGSSQFSTPLVSSRISTSLASKAPGSEKYLVYDIELDSWDSNNRHWAAPSNIKVWSNGDIVVYVKKLANMYRLPGIIDGGPPTSFGCELKFMVPKDTIEFPDIIPDFIPGPKIDLPFPMNVEIGSARIGLGGPLRYREERFDITVKKSFPGLADAILESHLCSYERSYQKETILDAVVISPPGKSF